MPAAPTHTHFQPRSAPTAHLRPSWQGRLAPGLAASAAKRPWAQALLALSLLTLPAQAQPTTAPATPPNPWQVTTLSSPTQQLALLSADTESLKATDAAGAPKSLPLSDLIRLSHSTPARTAPAPMLLLLRDGQRWPGEPSDIAPPTPDSLTWKVPDLITLSTTLKDIRGILRTNLDSPPTPDSTLGTGTDDALTLLNGDTLHGVVTELAPDHITLTPPTGDPTNLPWKSLRRLSVADLATAKSAPAPTFGMRLELSDGSIFKIQLISISDTKLSFIPAGPNGPITWGGPALSVPLANVRLLENQSGPALSLSLLRPTSATTAGFFSLSRPPIFDAPQLPTPRSITATAHTRLSWPIPPGYSRLRLALALDPSVEIGSATIRILADDKPLHESTLQPTTIPPAPQTLDLAAAKQLTIEIDFGPSAGVQSRVTILDPLLLK